LRKSNWFALGFVQTFSNPHVSSYFPLFSGEKSGVKKIKEDPNAPLDFPKPTKQPLHFFFHQSRVYNHSAEVLTNITFSNAHSERVLKCNKHKALYPAYLF
jgi:hypothetical protein